MNKKDWKKDWDYPKRKDGFMGRENRRYWLVHKITGEKKRITEKEFDEQSE